MHVAYNKLFKLLIDKGVSIAEVRKATAMSSSTFTRLRRNEPVTLVVLLKIAEYLDCDISEMCEFIKDAPAEQKTGGAQ
ncbi:MAG: helix-turn-helix transcriptional regulator [Eubacteriales bacterium]|nr:helix-turn-helix transcriptional regulator [Eubacteriales bacterium]